MTLPWVLTWQLRAKDFMRTVSCVSALFREAALAPPCFCRQRTEVGERLSMRQGLNARIKVCTAPCDTPDQIGVPGSLCLAAAKYMVGATQELPDGDNDPTPEALPAPYRRVSENE